MEIIDQLQEDFPLYTFGRDKENNLFIDGQKNESISDISLTHEIKDEEDVKIYDKLKNILLENKLISIRRK